MANLYSDLQALFPWLSDLGISPQWLQQTAAQSASSAEILARIRETPGYKSRFAGLKREDGSLRMTEAQYIATEKQYRTLLRQYGFDVDKDYSTPQSLIGWFDSEVAPDELQTRLQIYDNLKNSSQDQRDAFYVYTGRDLSVDDLYEATVDPAAEQKLFREYNQAVAQSSRDYGQFITRATQVGLSRVAESLRASKAQGVVTAEAVQRVLNIDPNFARDMMDAIYTGGDPGGGLGTLSLNELTASFEYALVGSAAQNAGLTMPTKERLAQIRAAGVDRQTQIKAYTQFGANKDQLDAAVQRARGRTFDQGDFENSQFFNDAEDTLALSQGVGYMEAAGKKQGGYQFDQDPSGRFIQHGFSNR